LIGHVYRKGGPSPVSRISLKVRGFLPFCPPPPTLLESHRDDWFAGPGDCCFFAALLCFFLEARLPVMATRTRRFFSLIACVDDRTLSGWDVSALCTRAPFHGPFFYLSASYLLRVSFCSPLSRLEEVFFAAMSRVVAPPHRLAS